MVMVWGRDRCHSGLAGEARDRERDASRSAAAPVFRTAPVRSTRPVFLCM